MGLAKLPKTFGIKEMKKGFFPHYFNVKENENYVGPLPDKKHYGTATMIKILLKNLTSGMIAYPKVMSLSFKMKY